MVANFFCGNCCRDFLICTAKQDMVVNIFDTKTVVSPKSAGLLPINKFGVEQAALVQPWKGAVRLKIIIGSKRNTFR